MKIISKFKDYYDYIMGIYGIDEKIIYLRKTSYETPIKKNNFNQILPSYVEKSSDYPDVSVFSICNIFYVRVLYGTDIYWGQEAKCLINNLQKWQSKKEFEKLITLHGQKNNLNTKEIPIAQVYLNNNHWIIVYENLRLSDYGFPSILPANEIFLMLSTFLSEEKEVKDTRTNDEKISANGFDLKTSFRK